MYVKNTGTEKKKKEYKLADPHNATQIWYVVNSERPESYATPYKAVN